MPSQTEQQWGEGHFIHGEPFTTPNIIRYVSKNHVKGRFLLIITACTAVNWNMTMIFNYELNKTKSSISEHERWIVLGSVFVTQQQHC